MVIPISAAHSVSNDTTNACSVATSIAFAVTVPDAAAYSTSHINTHSSTDVKADGVSISSPDEQPNKRSEHETFVRTFEGAHSFTQSKADTAAFIEPLSCALSEAVDATVSAAIATAVCGTIVIPISAAYIKADASIVTGALPQTARPPATSQPLQMSRRRSR